MTFQNSKEPISVLLPVYNESDVIEMVAREWVAVVESLPEGSVLEFEDGNSDDGTIEILSSLSREFNSIVVHFRQSRDGYCNAIRRLIIGARNEYVFIADSDGQYIASDLLNFLKYPFNPNVMLKGRKVRRCDPWPRRVFSFFLNRLVSSWFSMQIVDLNSCHYLIHKETFHKLLKRGLTFKSAINMELVLRYRLNAYPIINIPIGHKRRPNGPSRGIPYYKYLNYGIRALHDTFKLKLETSQND